MRRALPVDGSPAVPSRTVLIVDPDQGFGATADLLREAGFDDVIAPGDLQLPPADRPDPVLALLCVDSADATAVLIGALHEAHPGLPVVVLSGRDDGRAVYEAFKAGARGFGAKSAPPEEILGIVETVAGGGVAVCPAAATAGLLWVTRAGGPNDRLSSREREVLDLLRVGLPARVIGERLFLSRRTVESYLASAYRKLGVRGRHEAVEAYARQEEAG